MNANQTPAGWYQDPGGSGLRWWDGERWTQHVQAEPASQPPPGAPMTLYQSPPKMSPGGRRNRFSGSLKPRLIAVGVLATIAVLGVGYLTMVPGSDPAPVTTTSSEPPRIVLNAATPATTGAHEAEEAIFVECEEQDSAEYPDFAAIDKAITYLLHEAETRPTAELTGLLDEAGETLGRNFCASPEYTRHSEQLIQAAGKIADTFKEPNRFLDH